MLGGNPGRDFRHGVTALDAVEGTTPIGHRIPVIESADPQQWVLLHPGRGSGFQIDRPDRHRLQAEHIDATFPGPLDRDVAAGLVPELHIPARPDRAQIPALHRNRPAEAVNPEILLAIGRILAPARIGIIEHIADAQIIDPDQGRSPTIEHQPVGIGLLAHNVDLDRVLPVQHFAIPDHTDMIEGNGFPGRVESDVEIRHHLDAGDIQRFHHHAVIAHRFLVAHVLLVIHQKVLDAAIGLEFGLFRGRSRDGLHKIGCGLEVDPLRQRCRRTGQIPIRLGAGRHRQKNPRHTTRNDTQHARPALFPQARVWPPPCRASLACGWRLANRICARHTGRMTRPADLIAPSLEDFEDLAADAFSSLPADFRRLCGRVEIFVADFADAETLRELDMKDPFELTGVYIGIDLTQKSVSDPSGEPDRVILYRRPILDEWAERGDLPLGELVTHVLVHEIGHHFGLSDDDMHAIEDKS